MQETALGCAGVRIRAKIAQKGKLWLYLCASCCLPEPGSQLVAENLAFDLQDVGDCWRCVPKTPVWILSFMR